MHSDLSAPPPPANCSPRSRYNTTVLPVLLALALAACQFLPQGPSNTSASSNRSSASKTGAQKPANQPARTKTTNKMAPATPVRAPALAPPMLLSQPVARLQPAPLPPASPAPAQPARAIVKTAAAPAAAIIAPAIAPPIPAAAGESANPPAGFILPEGLFASPATPKPVAAAPATAIPANTSPASVKPPPAPGSPPAAVAGSEATAPASATPPSRAPLANTADDITRKLVPNKLTPVWIYASPTSRNFFAAGGINYQNNIDTWQLLLRRLDIPFVVIDNLSAIEKTGFKPAKNLLILPSAIALSETERRSLGRFHEQGGSLLATWLCGVRNERGEWLGFGFMENVLGTKVTGTTEADKDDTFLLPHGNNPVSHQLPAGLRVWTERIPNWYPLRLSAKHLAAHITDWSRTTRHDKRAGLISYEQRAVASGSARSVVLAYPERLWFSADPKAFDALASDAVLWLLREPAVYLSTWPWPYRSAFILSINASDFTEAGDDAFARQTEAAGWLATYYLLSEHAESGKAMIAKLAKRGHEIGYFGDRLAGFQNQSTNQQKKRIDTMVNELKELEIDTSSPPGFRAPMESFDATTIKLLRTKGISHIVADPGASEARLPVINPGPVAANGEQLVLLPRTLSGAEDLMADQPPTEAIKNYLAELDLAIDMGALGVVSLPTRTSLTPEQWSEILARLKARGKQVWLSSANQVSSWWREHERVKVNLNTDVSPALLTLEISGDAPLQHSMTLLVNLPHSKRVPLLFANGHTAPAPQIAEYDDLRAALILPKLEPGKYEWYLSFSAP